MKTEITIVNCPPEARHPCPSKWENLAPTDNESIRTCPNCDRSVFLCQTDKESIAHAKQKHCIARPEPDGSGLPQFDLDRAPNLNDITPVQWAGMNACEVEGAKRHSLTNAHHANRDCEVCGFPIVPWHKSCEVCEALACDIEKQIRQIAEQSPAGDRLKAPPEG